MRCINAFVAFCLVLPGVSAFAANANVVDMRHEEDMSKNTIQITHGVAVGDVTAHSAVIWSRADQKGDMHVRLEGAGKEQNRTVRIRAKDDFTGKVHFTDLKAGQSYRYRVWFSTDENTHREATQVRSGKFTTAPAAQQHRAVTFAWSGDLSGQNVCRDATQGFPIFKAINQLKADFFLALGDMIYADGVCTSVGLYGNQQIAGDFAASAEVKDYWAHWKYNREDAEYQKLLANTPYVAIWDDHEVVNDFGPLHDTRDQVPYTHGTHLLPLGLKAFLDYNPVAPLEATPKRLYRNIRWGRNLELFVLDNRQYRDANGAKDDAERHKTMLGREQLTWLKSKLASSDASWKIIVTSVPLSIPTGYPAKNGRDGWANFDQDTGFEQELFELLGFMRDKEMHNIVFITTDVHFAEVFRYTPFADKPSFQIHEYVTGPLNAGLFPNRKFDTSLGTESLFFYGAESFDSVTDYQQARGWMNFGVAQVDENGVLTMSVRDVDGEVLYENTYQPQ